MLEVVLIPSLDPDEQLLQVVQACRTQGFDRIVLVDDGSTDSASIDVFHQAELQGATVLRHAQNRGKGAALKTGIAYIREHFPDAPCIVTADGDGQHSAKDILAVAQAAAAPEKQIVMGVRSLYDKNTPTKSRLGNRFSAMFFRLVTGISCPDTQTGLRGIPQSLYDFSLEIEGERYEYEMNLLFAAAKQEIPLTMIPIETIYFDDNARSHFRPVRDAALIYKQPLKFALVSLSSSLVDLVLFTLLVAFLFRREVFVQVVAATVIARCLSGLYNFLMNKHWSFQSDGNTLTEGRRYLILWLSLMLTSGVTVALLRLLPINITVLKAIVDVVLFVISYKLQRIWVFKEE